MNTKRTSSMIAIVAAGAILAPVAAHAQYGRPGYGYGYGGGQWSIRRLIDQTERSSNDFRRDVEMREDRNDDLRSDAPRNYNLQARNRFWDALKPRVQRMDESFERLRREADDRRVRQGRDEMFDVVRNATEVDRVMNYRYTYDRNYRDRYYNNRYGYSSRPGDRDSDDWVRRTYNYGYTYGSNLKSHWAQLRSDINTLAREYGLPTIDQYRSGARYYSGPYGRPGWGR